MLKQKTCKKGVTEIILIAQDTTSYGIDIYKKPSLPKLLEELNKIEGLGWIRFMYAYPTHLDDELLDSVSKLDKVVKYVDIPLQHSHPEVLKLMNRPAFDYRPMIENIRKRIPDVSIRTAFIVGYPGETEEHFEHLCNFVRDMKFDRMGVFKYSREKALLRTSFRTVYLLKLQTKDTKTYGNSAGNFGRKKQKFIGKQFHV